MSMRVNKADYTQEDGFLYYVMFKPHMELGDETVTLRVPISAAVSVSETGDLADLTFTLPKQCRNENAVSFIRKDLATTMLAEQVLITMPGSSGDAVIDAPAKLDLDSAGRIVGMEIQWHPGESRGNA
jgi:hypothetical protein